MSATQPDLSAGARVALGPSRSNLGLFVARFLGHRAAVASLVVLAVMATAALCAPLVAAAIGHDPNAVSILRRFRPPSSVNWLGTDHIGRDLFVRLLYGARISLFAAITAALVAALIGTVVGLVAGYVGGWVDAVLMRFTDAMLALPQLPLYIVLAAVDLKKLGLAAVAQDEMSSLWRIVFIVALLGWTRVARIVRGTTLAARQEPYVRAARALGAGHARIMAVHILPNIASPIIVAITLTIGEVILIESVLSFLGLGIQPPLTSLGQLLGEGRDFLLNAWWIAVFPGIVIVLTTLSISLIGDWLRDVMDPTLRDGGRS